ncbi:MAG: polysaccharide export protein [Cytophagaceae bacterium]|nr:polysaccharide export protein [Cytophagaceae bacterium]
MKYILIGSLFFISISCIPHKKLLYLKPGENTEAGVETFKNNFPQYRVQPGDILDVEISSTTATPIEVFNKKFEGKSEETGISGYKINSDGNIDLPLVGTIHVDDLTIEQINDTLKTKLAEYIDFAYVKTRLTNFNITILGEVRNPGTKLITNDNINILQALGLAGDALETANKKKIKIVRKNKGETKIITLNVSQKEIVSSPYYYLMPNDIVYVEPLKVKMIKMNAATVSLIISAASLFFLILRYSKL